MSKRLSTGSSSRARRRSGRWLRAVIGLLLVAGTAVGAWYLFLRPGEGAAVEFLRSGEATLGELEIAVSASGNVAAEKQIDLSFASAGTVADIAVEVGDRVVPGQVLARLESDALERSVRQAELGLEQAELQLKQVTTPADAEDIRLAEKAIQQALLAMQSARTSEELAASQGQQAYEAATELADDLEEAYNRTLETLEKWNQPESYAAGITAGYMEAEGNVGITQLRTSYNVQAARSQYLAAYVSYVQATQNVEALKTGADSYAVKQVELQVAQAQLALARAQDALADITLYAPFGGIVTAVNLQRGNATAPSLPAVSLQDPSSLYVELAIDETDIGKVQVGQPARITVDAYADVPLEGSVEFIGLLPSAVTGVVTYEVRVRLVPDAAANVREGMTATVDILVESKQGVLLVPNWAVRTDQATGEVYAYRLVNGLPERVPIVTGGRNDDSTEILSGLSAGDAVVLISETVDLTQMQGPPSRGN